MDGASWVAVLVAAASAIISYVTYRSQSDPEVIVYARTNSNFHGVLDIVVENIGNAPAWNVVFILPIDMQWTSPEENIMDCSTLHTALAPLEKGIPFFPPRGIRQFVWGRHAALREALSGKDHTVVGVTYEASRPLGLHRRKHEVFFPLDIRSFGGTDEPKL